MKKISISLLFCCTYLSLSAQWTQLTTGLTDVLYNDMCFINNQIGFVAGKNYFGDPLLLKTIDGGVTWDQIPVAVNTPLTGVWFTNDSTGLISTCELILKTNDQGNTWDTSFYNIGYGFDQLFFVNDSVGYASYYIQLCNYGPVKFLKTNDGGNNWSTLNPILPEGYINDFYFISEDSGLASNFGTSYWDSNVFATSDGGDNWVTILTSTAYAYESVTAINHLTFLTAGQSDIALTEDGGNTFNTFPLPDEVSGSNPRNDMVFTSNNVGWMCGLDILKTEDGGHTWTIIDSTTVNYGAELTTIKFPSPDTGYAAGYNGLILKYVKPCEPFDSIGVISGISSVCEGDTVSYLLPPVNGATDYIWNTPSGSQLISSNGNEATVVFGSNSGDVTVLVLSGCDTISTSLSTSVSPLMALFTIVPDSTQLGLYYGYNLSTGNNLTYTWSWGDGATSSGYLPEHTYADSGYYNICLVISDTVSGCTDEFCANYQILKLSDTEGMHQVIFVNWPVGTPQAVSESIQWNVFPNPVTSNLTIEYSLPKENEVSIQLSDITGKNLRPLFSEKRSEGNHQEELNLDGIGAGVYLLKLQSGGKPVIVKIIKQ